MFLSFEVVTFKVKMTRNDFYLTIELDRIIQFLIFFSGWKHTHGNYFFGEGKIDERSVNWWFIVRVEALCFVSPLVYLHAYKHNPIIYAFYTMNLSILTYKGEREPMYICI